jgi:nucleotide-binding universal stress UspA family protein
MTHVLAAVDGVANAQAVAGVAAALADVLHVKVRSTGVDFGRLDAAAAALRELRRPDALLAVITSEPLEPAVGWTVVQRAAKPVVVVPPTLRVLPHQAIGRLLIPLDGTPEAAAAVDEAVELFAQAGVDLVVLHVFDEVTVPRFWDQPAHARRAFADEFLARHCAWPGARLELRSGVAGEQVIDVAAAERVDLIALGWSQRLDAGRARTVRRTVTEASVPVMLVPTAAG